jgi:hypothetical protein
MRKSVWAGIIVILFLTACNFPTPGDALDEASQLIGTAVDALPEELPDLSLPSIDEVLPEELPDLSLPSIDEVLPDVLDAVLSKEAVLILEPGPGSRLISPLRVAGIAGPAFEQTLGVRLVLDDGTLLIEQPAIIQAELGEQGRFEIELPFEISGERNALLQVSITSPRDGGITHLASVGVTLADSGEAQIVPGRPQKEAIILLQPLVGATVRGGTVQVAGVGLASFEGTLVVEIYDAGGLLVGSQPLVVDAPDIGLPGIFGIDVPYSVSSEGPGRIVVIDPLPVFDGIGHINSVEVTLAP